MLSYARLWDDSIYVLSVVRKRNNQLDAMLGMSIRN